MWQYIKEGPYRQEIWYLRQVYILAILDFKEHGHFSDVVLDVFGKQIHAHKVRKAFLIH